MPSETRVAALLADLARGLSSLKLRWYVFGAQAAVAHGSTRLTADVDITIDLGGRSTSEVIKALRKHGFRPQIPDPKFIETTRVIPLVHAKSRMPVDLVLAGPGLEDLFFQRSVELRVGRRKIPFASLEDLLAMKVLSGRVKDLDDVETLLAVRRGDVDVAVVRKTLRDAEALLAQSDLLPLFENLLGRAPATKKRALPVGRKAKKRR